MDVKSNKTIKKIEDRIKNGIRTIFVEGPADKILYRRIFPNSQFIYSNGVESIINRMKICNSRFGKTPLVVAIIDRDFKSDEDIASLAKENIFTLKVRELESIFLNPDVIRGMFGNEFFEKFSQNICMEASSKYSKEVTDYDDALNVLKKLISSKYSIRLLIKELGKHNRGNAHNIEFLCSVIDKTNSWGLVTDMIPKIDRLRYIY